MSEWKLVPVEPTEEMEKAARREMGCPEEGWYVLTEVYRAMLAAAPDAPPVQAKPADITAKLANALQSIAYETRNIGSAHILARAALAEYDKLKGGA